MKINGKGLSRATATPKADGVSNNSVAPTKIAMSSTEAKSELQSSVIQPPLASISSMPDMDHAKIAELRAALARGEISFNATRLAALIQRYHGNH